MEVLLYEKRRNTVVVYGYIFKIARQCFRSGAIAAGAKIIICQDRTLFGTVDIKITSDSERARTGDFIPDAPEARSESEAASLRPHFQIKFDLDESERFSG